eukprot:scaffold215572_cov21-Tisochrysis_lutea.AAC.1
MNVVESQADSVSLCLHCAWLYSRVWALCSHEVVQFLEPDGQMRGALYSHTALSMLCANGWNGMEWTVAHESCDMTGSLYGMEWIVAHQWIIG